MSMKAGKNIEWMLLFPRSGVKLQTPASHLIFKRKCNISQDIYIQWRTHPRSPQQQIHLPYYHIKHMPQILLILALQNTDMLKLLRFELIEPQRRMKEVKHAIVQCYAKESLLYNFTMSDVKKEVACQSNWSAMTSCPGWPPIPLSFNSAHNMSHMGKNGWFHKDTTVKNWTCAVDSIRSVLACIQHSSFHSLNQPFGRN